jgi:hypothetical protein
VHDTVRLIVQPAPTVNVEAPSQVPAIVLGVAGLLLLIQQLRIMGRQTDAMNRQTDLLDKQRAAMTAQGDLLAKQTALGEQQAEWRRDEAIGTFYRIAFDLADEFHKADILPSTPIPANYETHPRQMLREAAGLFAPLGNDLIFAATEIAERVDQYFSAVQTYNERPRGREGADLLVSVQEFREQVGRNLDRANTLIPSALRWKYGDGKEYDFRVLCSPARGLLEALHIETATPPEKGS